MGALLALAGLFFVVKKPATKRTVTTTAASRTAANAARDAAYATQKVTVRDHTAAHQGGAGQVAAGKGATGSIGAGVRQAAIKGAGAAAAAGCVSAGVGALGPLCGKAGEYLGGKAIEYGEDAVDAVADWASSLI